MEGIGVAHTLQLTHRRRVEVCIPRLSLSYCSGSMEPAFVRGDILFLQGLDLSYPIHPIPSPLKYLFNTSARPLDTGDIVVFSVDGREIPIVHRIQRMYYKYGHI